MTDVPPTAPKRQSPKRRAWWQWTLGLALLGVAALSAALRILSGLAPAQQGAVGPVPLVLPPEMRPAETVPAAPGEYGGSNLLLVTYDTTRADRLGCYGLDEIETPHTDALARRGVLFTRAFSPAPVTLPSHASMLTGLYPFNHGARVNAFSRLADDQTTLTECLSTAGYQTAAFVSAYVISRQFGLAQGFDTFDYDGDPAAEFWGSVAERRGDRTCDLALRWLTDRDERPFFLWVHFFDPHWTYDPPEPYKSQYRKDPYYGEIAFMDAQFGRLLDALDTEGLADQTLVIVAGDHGEGLYQHDESTHGCLLYDSVLHVPLLMACGDKLGGGVHIDQPVSLVDIMPTTLTLLGVDCPTDLDGIDLTRAIPAARPQFHETFEAYAEYGWAPLFAVRQGGLKYIYGPIPELFDLRTDQYEQANIVSERTDAVDQLEATLAGMYDDDLESAGQLDTTRQLSSADIAALESLGYLMGGASTPAAGEPLPDPKTMMPLLRRISLAFKLDRDNWLELAITELEEIRDEAPDFYLARRELATAYFENEDYEAAAVELHACLELQPSNIVPLYMLGSLRQQQGQIDEAITSFRQVLEKHPDHFPTLQQLGQLTLARGTLDEAVFLLTRANTIAPQHIETALLAATALAAKDRATEAVAVLREALLAHPDSRPLRNRLARILRDAGDIEGAISVIRAGMRLDPDFLDYSANLALILLAVQDDDGRARVEALAIMKRLCERTEFKNPGYVHVLGKALASVGEFDAAFKYAEQALQMAQASNQTAMAQAILADIDRFRAAQTEFDNLTPPTSTPTSSPSNYE